MNYEFSVEAFHSNFNWKPLNEKNPDSYRITHNPNRRFSLFPYKATTKKSSPIVTDMKEVLGDFIKFTLGAETPNTDFQELMEIVREEVQVNDEDLESLSQLIYDLFYEDNQFIANNIGLYAYKGASSNKSIEDLAVFFKSVFNMGEADIDCIQKAMEDYPYNALENLIKDCLSTSYSNEVNNSQKRYFTVFEDASYKFKNDFRFMLKNGMSNADDMADLLSLYYLYYTSQTCILLDHFGEGESRTEQAKLFFALDWEKVSVNRECCKGGWKLLSENVSHIFYHAVTLELLNQIENSSIVYDYKRLSDYVELGKLNDHAVALEIKKIEKEYTDAIGDYKKFSEISERDGKNETDSAIRHLYDCVQAQFINTTRTRASAAYVEKLTEFYKNRWLKNRKKAGLVLNLTERDIIFLTKISIQNKDRIRLIDLFKEYEKRGIYLDNTSKGLLQEFFTRLNLLDKKSDSGDAQYVKRIL